MCEEGHFRCRACRAACEGCCARYQKQEAAVGTAGAEQHEQQYQCHHNTLAFKNEAQSHHQQAADKEKRAGQTVRFVPNRRIREGPGSADAEKEVAFDFRQDVAEKHKEQAHQNRDRVGHLDFPGREGL